MEKTKKDVILATVRSSVRDLLYYDRKEDEDLGVGDIEDLIKSGGITVDEIIECYSNTLREQIEENKGDVKVLCERCNNTGRILTKDGIFICFH